ncbi:putative reverse transcriptase domain-containing protein [Tanacetum coccineum]
MYPDGSSTSLLSAGVQLLAEAKTVGCIEITFNHTVKINSWIRSSCVNYLSPISDQQSGERSWRRRHDFHLTPLRFQGDGCDNCALSRDLEAAFEYPVTHGHLSSYYMLCAACCMMLHCSSPTLWARGFATWCRFVRHCLCIDETPFSLIQDAILLFSMFTLVFRLGGVLRQIGIRAFGYREAMFLSVRSFVGELFFLIELSVIVDPKEEPFEMEPLMELKEIVVLIGLAGYYRRFITNSSKVAKPLASLTQKIQKYEWVKEQKEAFQTLKDNLCDTSILSLPDGSKEFVVYCDASNQGLGDVRTLMIDEAHASRILRSWRRRHDFHLTPLRFQGDGCDNCALSRDLEAAFEYPGEDVMKILKLIKVARETIRLH